MMSADSMPTPPHSSATTKVPMRFRSTPLLWTVDHVYSAEECADLVARIEAGAPALATNNPIYRDQDRVMEDDPVLAQELFQRLQPNLPGAIGELELNGLNPRLRFYRYRKGQKFEPHMDHWYQPDPHRITLLTVLVYLNEGFDGGETRFMEQLDATVVPHPGTVAIFQHKVRHEGMPVLRGRKYAFRSDVLYRATTPIELTREPEA